MMKDPYCPQLLLFIVSENQAFRHTVAALFQRAGHLALEMPSPAIAGGCALQLRPDLVLADTELPVADRETLAALLQDHEATKRARVLQFSETSLRFDDNSICVNEHRVCLRPSACARQISTLIEEFYLSKTSTNHDPQRQ
jgi:CheY-like chemotaxis protein